MSETPVNPPRPAKAPWWLWVVVVLVAVLAIFSWLRPHPRTLGERLIAQLEKQPPPLRGAIPLLDYTIDHPAWQRIASRTFEHGDDFTDLPGNPRSYWIRDKEFSFSWHLAQAGEDPLRAALAENSDAVETVAEAAGMIGFGGGAPRERLAYAAAPFDGLADEQLFLRWLQADRALLAREDVLDDVLAEALLLIAVPANFTDGTVVAFDAHDWRVYIFPGETRDARTSCPLQAYDAGGKLVWIGQLRLFDDPDAATVRAAAVWAAEEAFSRVHPSSPPEPPPLPGAPQ